MTTYAYNSVGDLSATVYSDSTTSVTNTFDRRGRTIQVAFGTNTTALVYNDAGNLLSESLEGLTVTNAFDSLLRRTNLQFQAAGSTLFNDGYGYDAASRMGSVTVGTNSVTYSYLTNSDLPGTVTFKNGATTRMTTTKTFDNLTRVTSISSVPSADATVSFKYSYNSANQRTAMTNADSSTWAFGYDNLGQVTSGKRTGAGAILMAGQQFEYGFDDIGNRRSAASGGDRWGVNLRYQNYTANNLNQYTQRTVPGQLTVLGTATNPATVTVNRQPTYRKGDYFRGELSLDNSSSAVWQSITNIAVLPNGTNADITTTNTGYAFVPKTPEVFSYDADGNLTNDGRWSYTWDAENRLLGMTANTNIPSGARLKLDFTYDSRSRRTRKTVSTWNGSSYVAQSTNRFAYDGWNLCGELDQANSLQRSYCWGLDLSRSLQGAGGVGGLVSVNIVTNGQHFVAYDGNGNTAALIAASTGTTSASYEYGAFGEVLRATGPMAKANPFRWSTKYQDDETDLLYYGYRYYKPSTGSWPSRDPIGERGGRNLYGYLANAILSKADYLGLEDVGTVTVEENHALSGWQIGWVMRLRWTPPEVWRGWSPFCLPCTAAVWVQDYNYDVEYYWWAFGDKDVHTGWVKDWDETDYAGSAVQWDAFAKSDWASTMEDEPQPGNWLQQFKVKSVIFGAKSKVKCIRGRDKGKIYATVEWGFYDYVAGGIEFSGGGIWPVK